MNRIGLTLVFLAFLFHSCEKENMGDCFKSTGNKTKQVRRVGAFSNLNLNDRMNYFITQSNEISLTIEGGENLLDLVETKVENGTLTIGNNNRCNWVRSFKKDINVYISAPSLNNIDFYGSGQLTFVNKMETDELFINLWKASGDLALKVDCKTIELKSHTGAGTIKCEGSAENLVAFMGAVGYIDASETVAENVLAVNVNVGNIKVNAQNLLKADISSKGNIEYLGDPEIELSDQGEGKLIRINN